MKNISRLLKQLLLSYPANCRKYFTLIFITEVAFVSNFFWRTQFLFLGPLISLSAQGFKVRVDPSLAYLQEMDSSDSPLVRLLLISSHHCSQVIFIHKHWWELYPRSSVSQHNALNYSAIPARPFTGVTFKSFPRQITVTKP